MKWGETQPCGCAVCPKHDRRSAIAALVGLAALLIAIACAAVARADDALVVKDNCVEFSDGTCEPADSECCKRSSGYPRCAGECKRGWVFEVHDGRLTCVCPQRKPRDKHCFEVNCRQRPGCTFIVDGNQIYAQRNGCEPICDTFCTRGRLEVAQ